MRILVIDESQEMRKTVARRLEEALRQAGFRRAEIIETDLDNFQASDDGAMPFIAFLGPSNYASLRKSVGQFRSAYPSAPLGIVLDNDVYVNEAVELRRELSVRVMPLADIAQMAQFILDSDTAQLTTTSTQKGVVVSLLHLKGGVGVSSLTAALGACWARHGLSTVLVDLDELNPEITAWGRVPISKRKSISDFLRHGSIPQFRVGEVVHSVDSFDRRLSIVGQPERYQESFHFVADVLDDVPSASEFVKSLITALQQHFDVVVIDTGRSWGISTFTTLPLSKHVLLVTDDDGLSLRRTIDNFQRLYKESDDPAEFDLTKWRWVLNAHTARLLSPDEVSAEIESMDLFPSSTELFTIPFSAKGRQWGAPGESLYDVAESGTKDAISELAFSLVPYRRDLNPEGPVYSKLKKQLGKFVGTSA